MSQGNAQLEEYFATQSFSFLSTVKAKDYWWLWDCRFACLINAGEPNYFYYDNLHWVILYLFSLFLSKQKRNEVLLFFFFLLFGRMKSVINHFKGNSGFPRLRIGTLISFPLLKYPFILQ